MPFSLRFAFIVACQRVTKRKAKAWQDEKTSENEKIEENQKKSGKWKIAYNTHTHKHRNTATHKTEIESETNTLSHNVARPLSAL